MANTAVIPGTVVGTIDKFLAGEGTYVRDREIVSALVGFTQVTDDPTAKKPTLFVERKDARPTVVPTLHSVVLAQVTKVNPRFASVNILCVEEKGHKPLTEPFPGTIKSSDVRQTQADQMELYKAFRPGDVLRAEVISLGDSRSYYLSTAKNEYGVVFAKSGAGATMVPISWNLMQCPKTKVKEYRKVAKIV